MCTLFLPFPSVFAINIIIIIIIIIIILITLISLQLNYKQL